ncbi:unnamed protein product [Amoebophrya sp. A25]|nr:unnamed protein product [Amoebophrya sp. A25]|eukprot:GSA25T00015525001.1
MKRALSSASLLEDDHMQLHVHSTSFLVQRNYDSRKWIEEADTFDRRSGVISAFFSNLFSGSSGGHYKYRRTFVVPSTGRPQVLYARDLEGFLGRCNFWLSGQPADLEECHRYNIRLGDPGGFL